MNYGIIKIDDPEQKPKNSLKEITEREVIQEIKAVRILTEYFEGCGDWKAVKKQLIETLIIRFAKRDQESCNSARAIAVIMDAYLAGRKSGITTKGQLIDVLI